MDNAKDKHSDEVCNECIVRDSDRNKKKLFSCKFCNEMLCLEHSNAKLILTQYKITTASRNIQRLYEQNYREKGHPCQEYDDYWHDQINKKQEQERNSLDKLLASGRLNKKNNSGGLDNDWRTYENADSDGNQIKIKKSTVAIIVLIIFAVCVFFLLPKFIGSGIPNPFEKTCTDKTISGACSINKPYKCVNGNLIYDALSCGCSEGQIVENAACRSLRSCSDGTQHNTCSINKPDFCNDGILEKYGHRRNKERHSELCPKFWRVNTQPLVSGKQKKNQDKKLPD